ncbi:alpha/beta hydrolase [Legionella sp. CNM-4043-24]|uniref:alpha/beta hydrolase n=1 Tax=Legionella sp. CNM-4043-24 TaxID=3421646 RepID=UPI00403AEC8C
MIPAHALQTPGEHPFFFDGAGVSLEAILTVPDTLSGSYLALLGHPHSLQGGSMNNKVVTTLARAFRELGIPSIRFNFRGVGQSSGVYDAGVGESEDMLALRAQWDALYPGTQVIYAGFSFGTYVTYRAAAQSEHELLISVAPAVTHNDYHEFSPAPAPWFIIQGDEDEVIPSTEVYQFAASSKPPIPVTRFADTTHFFHGRLLPLKTEVMRIVTEQVLPS